MILGEHSPFLALGATLGAGCSLLQHPFIGLLLSATVGAFFALTFGSDLTTVELLTFESSGMRIRARGMEFVVDWTTISHVDTRGHGLYKTVRLCINDLETILRSVRPQSASNRAYVAALISGQAEHILSGSTEPSADRRGFQLELTPWAGGLDAASLARAFRQGMKGIGKR